MAIIEHLGLDSSEFNKGLAEAERKTKSFSHRLGSFVGAPFASIGGKLTALVSAGALAKLTKDAVQFASSLVDGAEAARVSVESYQALSFAAREAGVDQDKMAAALAKLSNNAQAALDGNEGLQKALARLGLEYKTFAALAPDKQLETLGRAYVASGADAKAFAAVSDLLGEKAGPRLVQVIKRLADDGLSGVAKAAEDAGQMLSALDAVKLDALGDSIDRWKTRALVAIGEVVTGLGDLWKRITGQGINVAEQQDIDARARAISELENEGVIRRRIPGGPNGPTFVNGMPDMEEAAREAAAIEQRVQDIKNEIARKAIDERKKMEDAAEAAKVQQQVRIAGEVADIIIKAENEVFRSNLSLNDQLRMVQDDLKKQYDIAQDITRTEKERIDAAKEIARLTKDQAALEKRVGEEREKFRDRTRFSFDDLLGGRSRRSRRNRPTSEQRSGARQADQLERMAQQYRSWGRDDEADAFQKQAEGIRAKIPGLRSSDKNFQKDSYEKLKDIDNKLGTLAANIGVATSSGSGNGSTSGGGK